MLVIAVHLRDTMQDLRVIDHRHHRHPVAMAGHGLIIPHTDDPILRHDPVPARPVGAEAGVGAEVDTAGVILRSQGHDRGLHRHQDDEDREVMVMEEDPLEGTALDGVEAAGDGGIRALAAIAVIAIDQGAGAEIEVGGGDSLADFAQACFFL